MKLVIRALPLLFLFLSPLTTVAADIDYARAIEHTDTQVLIKQDSFTKENWYTCSTSSLSCSNATKDTTIVSPDTYQTLPFMQAYRALMPQGAQSLTRSPDGRYIAFYIPATQSRNTRTFGIMDTTDLSIYTNKETVAYWDLLTEGIRYYVFSPDSKTLIYLDDAEDETTLFKVDLSSLSGNTFKGQRLFTKDYSVADVVFKDNDTIFYVANRDNPYAWNLYELNINTYNLTKIAGDVSYADNLWLLGNKLLFTKADKNGVKPALFNLITKSIEYFDFPSFGSLQTEGKVITNLSGGLTGVFLLEESGWSDTLLVWLHGGPYRQTAIGYHPYKSYGGYDWVLEKAREADVGVLKLDYPGSYGFGRNFAESITGNIGVIDSQKTVAAIKDFATRNSYEHVYVMGNSYGGYLALKILMDAPTLIDGAFSINGVADWLTLLTRLDTSIFNVQFAGTVNDENRAEYQKASIYNYADRIQTQKVILMHGGSDRTIPYSQSEGLSTYLSLIGKQHTYIKLDGEDHVFKKTESFEKLCNTTLSFVGRTTLDTCNI